MNFRTISILDLGVSCFSHHDSSVWRGRPPSEDSEGFPLTHCLDLSVCCCGFSEPAAGDPPPTHSCQTERERRMKTRENKREEEEEGEEEAPPAL